MPNNSIYLIAYYYLRPARRANTQSKGWMKDNGNLVYDEKVAVSKKLNKNDHAMAKIIIDLANKQVVRNGWGNDLSFDQIFEYFHEGYPQYTTQIMQDLDPGYLEQFKKPENESTVEPNTESISSSA